MEFAKRYGVKGGSMLKSISEAIERRVSAGESRTWDRHSPSLLSAVVSIVLVQGTSWPAGFPGRVFPVRVHIDCHACSLHDPRPP